MLSLEDEAMLITPKDKTKKESKKNVVDKIFGNFKANKEDK